MRTTSRLVVLSLFSLLLVGCASSPPPAPVEPSPSEPMVAQPMPAQGPGPSSAPAAESSGAMSGAASRDVSVGGSSEAMRAGSARPAAARPAAAPASAGAPGSCKLAGEGDSPVDKACNEGGLLAAKQTMKGLLRAGRAAGIRHECDDCHMNAEDYSQLSRGADEKFAKLLAATKK